MSELLIALRSFPSGGRSYAPGDQVDPDKLEVARESLKETMRRMGYFGPLTREKYAACMNTRPAGDIGRGFTRPQLEALGILDPVGHTAQAGARQEGDEEYEGYLLRVRKAGNMPMYTILTLAGELVSQKEIGGRPKTMAFIESLKVPHDGDVQREPADAD